MNPLITIIVPIYKVENYLERCIKSILAQTYNNIEIILVDDGSPDRCPQICDQFQKVDSRIRVIHKKNGGLSDARNAGFEVSSGDLICFVDSDDYISVAYIENLYKIITLGNCDIAVCDFESVDTFKMEHGKNEDFLTKVTYCTGIEMMSHMYDDMFLQTVVAWNKMYKREILEGTCYPVGLIHEDEATTCKYLYKAKRVGYTPEKLYYYYVRPNSIMTSEVSAKKLDAKIMALQNRICFLTEKNLVKYQSLDTLRLLKQISKSGYLMHEVDSDFEEKMHKAYKDIYKHADKSAWDTKNRLVMFLTFYFPNFYGMFKTKR